MKHLFTILFFSLCPLLVLSEGDAIKNGSNGSIKNLSTGKIKVNQRKNIKNAGTIDNEGEIDIDEQTNLESDGNIINTGTITSKGQISKLNQTDIGGVVIMDTKNGNLTNVPTINYNNLQLKGDGRKIFDSNGNSVGVQTFFSSDTITPIFFTEAQELRTFGEVLHNGRTNPTDNHGKVGLYGNAAQSIHGVGRFQQIVLDNPAGADVVNGGGFSITRRLDLVNGEFRNSNENNFILGDNQPDETNVQINRVNGSLADNPEITPNTTISISYKENSGTQHISGPEIPANGEVLALGVENPLGLELSKDVQVNDSLYIGSTIRTYSNTDADADYTLTLNSSKNPLFGNIYSEIDGSFQRTQLPVGFVNLFNNRFTSVEFATEEEKNGLSSVTLDVRPDTEYTEPDKEGETKVARTIAVSGVDTDGNEVESGFNMNLSYAWIHRPPVGTPGNETFADAIDRTDELKMLHWLPEGRWQDVSEDAPVNTKDVDSDWIYSNVFISDMGEYGIGFPALNYLYLMANAILEGPYRPSAGIMDTTLYSDNGPVTPPNIYPYNLDPNREGIVRDPSIAGIVDWVVLEFRTEQTELFQTNDSVFYRTALLRYDGELINPEDGNQGVALPRELTMNQSGTKMFDSTGVEDYYIAIRHRNHLAVVSQNSFSLSRDFIAENKINFNDPSFILGGSLPKDPEVWDIEELTGTALKIVAFDNGQQVYGIAAGSAGQFDKDDGKYIIDAPDFQYVWDNINAEGYFYEGQVMNADYNMDGIVNSLDFNISWNNRKRAAAVDSPK